MASTSETGHAVNVANFEDLISFCTGYGAKFNPTKENIKIAQLQALHASAINHIENVNQTQRTFLNSTNQRENAFQNLNKLSTKIINALSATDATTQTVDDARTLIHKLTGKRATPVKVVQQTEDTTPILPTDKTISTSQTSFDSRLNTFQQLINLATAEISYNPNETELQTATLTKNHANMKIANTNVVNAFTDISNARIARNKILYDDNSGLCDTAQQIKNYVKSVFGASSPEYRQVSKIKFTKK